MKRLRIDFFVAALVALSILTPNYAQASAILWGLDQDRGTLFNVDTTSGQVTTIGSYPNPSNNTWGGLDFDSNNNLYALFTGGPGSRLYLLNQTTAEATLIGQSDYMFETFEIVGDTAYAADFSGLYKIDLTNGSATHIGEYSTLTYTHRTVSLASDGANLFGVDVAHYVDGISELFRFDLSTGAIDEVIGRISPSVGYITSLAYADGLLWTIPTKNPDALYSIDPNDATTTYKFTVDVGRVTGLTAGPTSVPEPSTLLITIPMLGSGLLWAVRTRRRRED